MMDVALAPLYFVKTCSKRKIGRLHISLSHDLWEQDERVLVHENDLLISLLFFPENEIKEAVWSCDAEGALGPCGLFFMFYHKCSDLIEKDLLHPFE
jgi:hypothetical protein